ncbi:MAG: iron-containing redox enzyme family protein [Alphaproteobacteria bacterium]|jgi:hypothetical protein|nr:iron-containing redox enzyme family protein [Alphaproteobacteria bacterium]
MSAVPGILSHQQQMDLARFNRNRLVPAVAGDPDWRTALEREHHARLAEHAFIEDARTAVAPLLDAVPDEADAFVAWFEDLKRDGPGQYDPLFPYLAEKADLAQMRWFLRQEVAGEAGFEDLVALTQLRLPDRPKLEMARNFWDEMGRGNARGMHGPMLARLADHLGLDTMPDPVVAEALALANLMVGLAANRRYAYQSIGALGVIELTAPTRAPFVDAGLRRLGLAAGTRHYFTLHATLDVRHSAAWNHEVLLPLVADNPACARPIAEGALLRLWCGARCFERYRRHFAAMGARFREGAGQPPATAGELHTLA